MAKELKDEFSVDQEDMTGVEAQMTLSLQQNQLPWES